MNEEHWELVYEANGQLEAEMLRGLLEAEDITVFLNQEGAGHAFALTVGPMGMVQILVPASQAEYARQILQDYDTGKGASSDYPEDDFSDEDLPDDEDM